MIFGRKRKAAKTKDDKDRDLDSTTDEDETETAEQADEDDADTEVEAVRDTHEGKSETEPEDDEPEDDESEDDESEEDEPQEDEPQDTDADQAPPIDGWRHDGPFDFDEVDLDADEVARLDLGSLIITPWDGLGLQLQVREGTQEVQSVLAVWGDSGIELTLFAAPTSGGLAEEFLEDLLEEAEQAGGSAQSATGPFGPEVRRVMPQEGPKGEQLFHVARIWFAEGPRWMLRGTLLGEVGLTEAEESAVQPFLEFFRNVVVRRGEKPQVPGELIPMTLPQGAAE